LENYDSDDSDYKIALEDQAKKARENAEEERSSDEDGDSEDGADLNKLSTEQFNQYKLMKFGQREINNVKEIKERLHEVK